MSGEELRVHARIQVSTSIEVRRAGGGERLPAVLKDLSKGGARFVVGASVGDAGGLIELFLPSLSGPDITVIAQIIRATPGTDGITVACRFDEVAPEMRQPLLDLIEKLRTKAKEVHDELVAGHQAYLTAQKSLADAIKECREEHGDDHTAIA